MPAEKVEPEFRSSEVQLWLGPDAHLVHYPVKGGAMINIVAIVNDRWAQPGWSAEGDRDELLGALFALALVGRRARCCCSCPSAGSNGRSTICRRCGAGAMAR